MKLVRCFSAFLLCLCLAVCLTACGGGQDVENHTSADETVSEEPTDTEPDTGEINTDGKDTDEGSETETAASTEKTPETAADTSGIILPDIEI